MSELGHAGRDIGEGLADKMLSALGLSLFLLPKGQYHLAELSRLLLQYTELVEGRCASGHSAGQLLNRTPEKRDLPEWISLELFSIPTILRGSLQPRLLLLPSVLA